jgi:hypothetical protein
MKNEECNENCCMKGKLPFCCKDVGKHGGGAGGAVYGIGLIGALVYFLQHATSFGDGVFGVLKAIVWPALLVYKAFTGLGI